VTGCSNTTEQRTVLVALRRNGSGEQVFANGQNVTISASATAGLSVPSTVGVVALPANWTSLSNNTLSTAVPMTVTINLGLTSFSGTISFSAPGLNTDGDSINRTDSMTVNVTVNACDSTPPTVTVPGPLTAEATGPGGAAIFFNATASDTNPVSPAVTCVPASGSAFPLGDTTVTCSATDAAGNTGSATFTVTVQDTTAPVVTPPATPASQEATSPNGAAVSYGAATALDIVDGAIAATCAPPSGSTFPLGDTTVTCSATDAAGNPGSASFTVTVEDTTAPEVDVPEDQSLEATGPDGASFTWTATANDIVDGPLTPTCLPASPHTFPLGLTTVTCSATDAAGNPGSASFTVTVEDTTPPTIAHHNNEIAEATGPSGAVVNYDAPTASDLVDGPVPVTCSPASGSTFALGTTTVHCSATDAAGNTATKNFNVTVVDTTPPALTVPAGITVPATAPTGAVVTFTATATDLVDSSPIVVCVPPSGSTFAIGTTTVSCSATDDFGNTSIETFVITVQHQLKGFYQPVDMNGIYNVVKGGSTVPLKFEVFAGSTEITDTAVVDTFVQTKISCTGATAVDDLEFTTTGGTTLRYDSLGGQFIQNWQTPKLPGQCYRVTMTTDDGASLVAFFKLK
jgi:hypothetical protein